jgi:outer membrane protein OmpA-like peptidoglycan-associated protein
MKQLFGESNSPNTVNNEESHWISMSDLMAGLMMVFLFISIAYMRHAQIERDKIKEVAVTYQNTQVALYENLQQEFADDLPLWDAEIDQSTLEFRFKSPEVLFDVGKNSLKEEFKRILDDFFPRYLAVIGKFKDNISEIRIEGHTSSAWNRFVSADEAYFHNMELSQGRTRSVLEYVYLLPEVATDRSWIKSKFAAVGLSSSQLVFDAQGLEDDQRSRRVSFKVMTNAETQIRKIIAD